MLTSLLHHGVTWGKTSRPANKSPQSSRQHDRAKLSPCCVAGCLNQNSNGSKLKFYCISAAAVKRKKQLWLKTKKWKIHVRKQNKQKELIKCHKINFQWQLYKDPPFIHSVSVYESARCCQWLMWTFLSNGRGPGVWVTTRIQKSSHFLPLLLRNNPAKLAS